MNKPKAKSQKPKALGDLQEQVAELTEALQRERADSVNLRRRVDEERAELGKFYKAMVVRDLLPAVDNLERALMHVPKDLKNHDYVKGVQAVIKQFETIFKQLGVEQIKTVGEVFDPKYHEAISIEDKGGKREVVSAELQSGYKINDEIIRHAMVRVRRE